MFPDCQPAVERPGIRLILTGGFCALRAIHVGHLAERVLQRVFCR